MNKKKTIKNKILTFDKKLFYRREKMIIALKTLDIFNYVFLQNR